MSEVLDRSETSPIRTGIVDCDIHPTMRSQSELHPWLSEQWRSTSRRLWVAAPRAVHHRHAIPESGPSHGAP